MMRDSAGSAPIAVWFLAGVALMVAFEFTSNPFLAKMIVPVVLLGYLGATVLLLIAYIRSANRQRTRESWLAAVAIPVLLSVLILIAPLVSTLVLYAKFAAMLPTYSRIISALTQAQPQGVNNDSEGVEYTVDAGPPLRVAFPKDGIVDNWWGFVYDPTDAVAQARGWDFESGEQRFTAPPQIKSLFGGDLVSCRHLYRHYYSCSFT